LGFLKDKRAKQIIEGPDDDLKYREVENVFQVTHSKIYTYIKRLAVY